MAHATLQLQFSQTFSRLGAALAGLALLAALFLPVSAHAVDPCTFVAIDNDTTDWQSVQSRTSSAVTTPEEFWYYNSVTATWEDQAAFDASLSQTDYTWRTDVERMWDIVDVKVCNSAVELFTMYEGAFPLLGLERMELGVPTDVHYEIGDISSDLDGDGVIEAPGANIATPVDFNKWIVFTMSAVTSPNDELFYAVNLAMDNADTEFTTLDLGFYEDTDQSGTFDPTVDLKMLDFDPGNSSSLLPATATKQFDEGQLELDLDLVTVGNDVFSLTGWNYLTYLNISVATYDDSVFSTTAPNGVTVQGEGPKVLDETESFTYRIKARGLDKAKVQRKKPGKRTIAVTTPKVGAETYVWQLRNAKGKILRERQTDKSRYVWKNLKRGKTYKVRVKAKFEDHTTPYSAAKRVRLKKKSAN